MLRLCCRLANWFKEEEGQGLVEYSLIILLVSVTLIAGLGFLQGSISGLFSRIDSSLAIV